MSPSSIHVQCSAVLFLYHDERVVVYHLVIDEGTTATNQPLHYTVDQSLVCQGLEYKRAPNEWHAPLLKTDVSKTVFWLCPIYLLLASCRINRTMMKQRSNRRKAYDIILFWHHNHHHHPVNRCDMHRWLVLVLCPKYGMERKYEALVRIPFNNVPSIVKHISRRLSNK